MTPCAVCKTNGVRNGDLCLACARSYDRWRASPANRGDAMSMIRWAATRARRCHALQEAQRERRWWEGMRP